MGGHWWAENSSEPREAYFHDQRATGWRGCEGVQAERAQAEGVAVHETPGWKPFETALGLKPCVVALRRLMVSVLLN